MARNADAEPAGTPSGRSGEPAATDETPRSNVSPQELRRAVDAITALLQRDITALLEAAEAAMAELDALDDMGAALDGDPTTTSEWLAAAERARRIAVETRTRAAENCRDAHDLRAAAARLARRIDQGRARGRSAAP